MYQSSKRPYAVPAVLQTAEVQWESVFLDGSIANSLNQGGVETVPMEVEKKDFSDADTFNFKWE